MRRTASYILRTLSDSLRWAVHKPNGEQLFELCVAQHLRVLLHSQQPTADKHLLRDLQRVTFTHGGDVVLGPVAAVVVVRREDVAGGDCFVAVAVGVAGGEGGAERRWCSG